MEGYIYGIVFAAVIWIIIVLKNPPKVVEKTEKVEITHSDNLRPKLTESYLTLDNYIGQKDMIEYIKGHIITSAQKGVPMPHMIFWGPGGLGKSTLVKAIANHTGGRFFEFVPAGLRTIKDLYAKLFGKECLKCGAHNQWDLGNCIVCKYKINHTFKPFLLTKDHDILFFEECHGLKQEIEEAMYSLMQDGYMILRYNGQDQPIHFPKITVVGATTQLGDLNKPFRDRFKLSVKLEPYSEKEIQIIGKMYTNKTKNLEIEEAALQLVGKISHGTPRITKKHIDDAETRKVIRNVNNNIITIGDMEEALRLNKTDENGLDETHRKIMKYILTRMKAVKNGGAGASSIASSTGIQTAIYMEVYEPALMYQDLLFQGPKGRRLTEKALNLYFTAQKKDIKL